MARMVSRRIFTLLILVLVSIVTQCAPEGRPPSPPPPPLPNGANYGSYPSNEIIVALPDFQTITKQILPPADYVTVITLLAALVLVTSLVVGVDAAVVLGLFTLRPLLSQLINYIMTAKMDGPNGQEAFAGISDAMRDALSQNGQPISPNQMYMSPVHPSPLMMMASSFLGAFAKQFAASLTNAAIQGVQQQSH